MLVYIGDITIHWSNILSMVRTHLWVLVETPVCSSIQSSLGQFGNIIMLREVLLHQYYKNVL